jgi:hypothetical protein
VAPASSRNDHFDFPVHSAYGNAITPSSMLLSTPPAYLPNPSRNRLPDFTRLPADRKPGVDGIESPDYDRSHLNKHWRMCQNHANFHGVDRVVARQPNQNLLKCPLHEFFPGNGKPPFQLAEKTALIFYQAIPGLYFRDWKVFSLAW